MAFAGWLLRDAFPQLVVGKRRAEQAVLRLRPFRFTRRPLPIAHNKASNISITVPDGPVGSRPASPGLGIDAKNSQARSQAGRSAFPPFQLKVVTGWGAVRCRHHTPLSWKFATYDK